MYFFKISAFLLAAAACAVADLDFSGNFGRDSTRQLRGSGFGGRGIGNSGFDQGFGGQAASARAATYVASSAGSSSGYGLGNQDAVLRLRGSGNYGYGDNNLSRGQRTQADTRVLQYATGYQKQSNNYDDDFGVRRYGSNNLNRNARFSGLLRAGNTGFSGMSAVSGSNRFGLAPVSTFSSVPAVLLAFPSIPSFSYGAFPYVNGFYGPYSGSGFTSYNRHSDNNDFSGLSKHSDNSDFAGYNRFDDSNGYPSDNNDFFSYNRFDDSGSNFKRSGLANQADSAALAQTRTYNKVYSDAESSNRNAGSSGNVAFLPLVTVPGASSQGNQAAASRHTKVVKTTITESEDNPNQDSVANGGLRAAVVPVVTANYGSGSYGGNSGSNGGAAAYSSAASASSFTPGSAASYGGRSSGFNGNTGSTVASSRSFSASSSQSDSAALDDMN